MARQNESSEMNAPDFLVESIPNIVHGAKPRAAQNPWLAVIFPFMLSIAVGVLCYRAAGASLGLFLGGLLFAGLLTGPIVAAEPTWLGRSLAMAGMIHGLAAVWFYAVIQAELDFPFWAASYLVLASLVIAIGGLTALVRSALRLGPIGSGAIAGFLSMGWLLWPIWLSPALHGESGIRIARWLVPAHPIFALNSVLGPKLGYWAEQAITYNLTNLGDDIGYSLPSGILWCLLLHLGFGLVCVGITAVRWTLTSTTPIAANDSSDMIA